MSIPILLVFLGAVARILPHPANFAPIGAIALFAGLYLPRRMSFVVPLLAMFASDLVIGFYDIRIMAAVYGSFLLSIFIGRMMKNIRQERTRLWREKTIIIIGGTTLGAIIFFLMTNAAVWAFGTLYPHTMPGLWQSYVMALPFFRNSLLGDLFFTGILVGGYEIIRIASGAARAVVPPQAP